MVLIALWLSRNRHSTVQEAFSFLAQYGASQELEKALKPVLVSLWREAWQAGSQSAAQLSGKPANMPPLPRQPKPSQPSPNFPDYFGAPWLHQIIQTMLESLADIFAEGGSEADIRKRVEAYLGSGSNAERIATTEVTRAMQAAAIAHYHAAGIHQVRWVTAHDAKVCAECDANAKAGPHPLGTPFPSGAIAPPQHPRCRCALIPA